MRRRLACFVPLCLGLLLAVGVQPGGAQDRFIVVSSTTSTEQSGLFGHILPLFKAKTGIEVRVVALGTGQALDVGRRGDADVVFVHDRAAEERFIAEGFGVTRLPVMYNDFIIVGPKSDPAALRGLRDTAEAFRRLADRQPVVISRGDRSGTHMAELRFWRDAGIDIAAAKGPWYRDVGQGMGPALNTAAASEGYVLTDRGTWLNFRNRQTLEILVEGDRKLFNQYGVILVNPQKHPQVKRELGQGFIDWLLSAEGQAAIAGYKIGGEQLFFPNAADPGA